MATRETDHSLAADVGVLCACAALILVIHFLLGNGYGFHRDELQFLDDARHLQWGFVAYPPLTSFCARIAIALFGISPGVLRLPAAVVNTASLVLVGLMARELGGRRVAQVAALFAAFPMALVFSTLLQYNSFDLFAWCLLILFTLCVLRTGDERYWIGAGVGVGLGVLSKYSIVFPVASMVAAVALLPSQRRHLRSRWFWYGALVALAIALPNFIWLARHQFITLQMEHHIHVRDVRLGRAKGYFTDQVKFTMFLFPLAMVGLCSLVRSEMFRLASCFYMGPLVLLALAKGRGYYLLPGYTVLYAAGAVALQHLLAGRKTWLRASVGALVVAAVLLDTAAFTWAYLPMWKVGSPGWKWQMANNNDMANEVGWPEFVAQVAAVRDGLPVAERDHVMVLANNFGEAGALELYGPKYGLPTPISSTNSFHARGYGPPEDTVIVLGSNLQDQLENFERCSIVGNVKLPYGVRNEETDYHPEILVCHHLRGSWPVVWWRSQQFG